MPSSAPRGKAFLQLMKIILLGKSNQMGSTPNIRVKGMSQNRYNFIWDKEIRHFAYEPKDQKEVDDIFRTQGKIYRTMYFSVWLDAKEEEEPDNHFVKEKPRKKAKKESNTDLQGVDELVTA